MTVQEVLVMMTISMCPISLFIGNGYYEVTFRKVAKR